MEFTIEGNVLPSIKLDFYWSVQTKTRRADYTFDIYEKFITLTKYSKNPKVLTNITHRFIALNSVKMLPVIYEKHEEVHLTLCQGTLLLINIASKSEYPTSITVVNCVTTVC